jgi:hypothetical protein
MNRRTEHFHTMIGIEDGTLLQEAQRNLTSKH